MAKFIFKTLGVVVVLGAIGVVGFAYLGDLSPTQVRVSEPVTLRVGGGG